VVDEAPLLSATWINKVFDDVFEQAIGILEDILDDLTYSGYLPLETPPSAEFRRKAKPSELQMFVGQPAPPEPGFQESPMAQPPITTSGPLV